MLSTRGVTSPPSYTTPPPSPLDTLTPDYIPHDEEYAAQQPHVDEIITSRRAFQRTMVPEDMVGTLIYLLSPLSSFVTGQNIWVNAADRDSTRR